MDLSKKIEGILFYKGEPVSISFLQKTLDANETEINDALDKLSLDFENRGVTLIRTQDSVSLGTDSSLSGTIEILRSNETEKELTPAALETLSIILYRGPISRSDINFIRGVNSAYILRNLLVRGLINKRADSNDRRSLIYEPSIELLSHLGVQKIEDLPNYDDVNARISSFYASEEENEQKDVENQTD